MCCLNNFHSQCRQEACIVENNRVYCALLCAFEWLQVNLKPVLYEPADYFSVECQSEINEKSFFASYFVVVLGSPPLSIGSLAPLVFVPTLLR